MTKENKMIFTPQEKAIILVNKYDLFQAHVEGFGLENAKECATIAVDEILKELFNNKGSNERLEYFHQVQKEIKKL